MLILAINLPPQLIDALSHEMGENIRHTEDIEEACELIKNEDFTIIIKSIGITGDNQNSLSTLLGLTPPSTRILLIGTTKALKDTEQWQELGIEIVPPPTMQGIIAKLRH